MKKILAVVFAFLLTSLAMAGVAAASTINLTGTVRDFQMNGTSGGHVDFENYCCGDDHGIVTSTLGIDGKPVYAGGSPSTHGAAAFNQWYRDTAGVNLSALLTITLDDAGHPGVYTYANSNFFPIDGALFGNQSLTHNYAFTFELHTTFGYAAGQTFSFTGDDDVFIYINGAKVIDLGGVHAAETAAVNLDTLGLTTGNNYALDVFFAERHTVASSFRIDTSITNITTPVPDAGSTLLLLGMALTGLRAGKKRIG
jgi:fibro-slime domain-containing protein